jgi:hypothetical protein
MSEVGQRKEQLPSARSRQFSGAATRGDGADAARAAKIRRNAWLLAGVAAFFYLGFIVWNMIKAQL